MAQYKPIVEKTIQEADGVMIIVSTHTLNDPLALWEIDCSLFHSISIVGVDVRQKLKGIIPASLEGKMIKFGWEWFADFFNGL